MTTRPDLVDNLSPQASHTEALAYLLGDTDSSHGLSVATGYVSLDGLSQLAHLTNDGRQVRLLIGASPPPGLGEAFPQTLFDRAMLTLGQDRDLSRFPPSRAATKLAEIDAWLTAEHVEVRRYVDRFLHGKAYLLGNVPNARSALVTSANLTGAGLTSNLELGLVDYNPGVAGRALEWFERLWRDADEFGDELRSLLFPPVEFASPRTIYLRALLELLNESGEEPSAAEPTVVALAPFQRDGYERALRILQRHHGVIYADGVGTGKTEIGLALIEEYERRRGLTTLVVAPAQLVSHWDQRLRAARLGAQVVSFHQFANDEQLAGPNSVQPRRHLRVDKDTYRLVIVDEGHAFRTPSTTWYRAMTRLMGGTPKDLALLTATPINNGLWDLYHLVMTFARHDRAFSPWGIESFKELFIAAGANQRDAENLDPDVLFELADMVSVRRDRRFIAQHYPSATFPDGTPVQFPAPLLSVERYDLDAAHPGLVSDITSRLGRLTMARYRPSAFRIGDSPDGGEAALGALLQSSVLKRFESCWHACRLTLDRMVAAHRTFLGAWEQGRVLTGDQLATATALDLDDTGLAGWLAESESGEHDEPVNAFEPHYRDHVSADLDLLTACLADLGGLDADSDRKLAALRRLLAEVRSDKVIVFSTFADTIRYLDNHLPARPDGRERVTVIGAETDPDQRTALLARFCPDTVVHPGYVPSDGEVDLLLSNDVLSEGQNLQQAAAVISYDMPWNPQRVVQRYGRVVRLRSPHARVFLITMLPTQGDLERFLSLESAIQRKIVAARPFGMEIDVVEAAEAAAAESVRTYAQRLLDNDPALLDDSTSGDSFLSSLSGEGLRAELRRAAAEGELERLRSLPWGIGAAFHQGAVIPSNGASGTFLACRTANGSRHWRYIADDGDVLMAPGSILRRINPGNAEGVPSPDVDLDAAWQAATVSITEELNDASAARSGGLSIGPVQRWARSLLEGSAGSPQANAAYDALAVERSTLVRHDLADAKRSLDARQISASEAAAQVIGIVEFYGLDPVELPAPRASLTDDDIGVVCWMSVRPPAD